MPISEAYKDRSIVPDALAFPQGGGRSEGGGGVISYQEEVTQNVEITNVTVVADTNYTEKRLNAVASSIADAERRAKAWTAEYERVGRWDIKNDVVVTTNTNDPIQCNQEVIRIMGAEFTGTVTTAGAKWRYICPTDAEGLYLVSAFVMYTLTAGMASTRVRLATFIDGVQWSVLDNIDRGYAGEAPIIDAKLQGTDLVPLKAGQELTIQHFIQAGTTADQTLGFPTSVYGRVWLARTRCEMEDDGNGKKVNSPISGNGYIWNN